jgi:hypothetical protein
VTGHPVALAILNAGTAGMIDGEVSALLSSRASGPY